jgi:glycosyltransferase involved in cell wall biosynthesis
MSAGGGQKLKVALVTASLPLGGTTTFSLFLCAGLKQSGVEARVFSFTKAHPLAEEFSSWDIPVHVEDDGRLIFEDRVAGIYDKLREFQPTVVFAVLGGEAFEFLRYVPAGVLRVGMVHDHHPPVYETLRAYKPFCDQVVAVAASIRDYIRSEFRDVTCTYLQHGVLFKEGEEPRAANPTGKLRLLFFGRFDQGQKQVLIFPEIWRELKRLGVACHWTIHGAGPAEAALRAGMAAAVRAGEATFSTPMHYDQLGGFIRQHDVYVMASLHEAGPLTLIEAMGRGLVPVCSDIPCLVEEIVRPENGFRVAVRDPAAYAQAIARLDQDRTLLEALSQRARQTISEEFTAQAMARRYMSFVEQHPTTEARLQWPAQVEIKPVLVADWKLHWVQRLALARSARRWWRRRKA